MKAATSLDRNLRNVDDANRILRANGIRERLKRVNPRRPALPYLVFVDGSAHLWPDTILPSVATVRSMTGRALLTIHRELVTPFALRRLS